MADLWHKTTFQHKPSANEARHAPADWLINPSGPPALVAGGVDKRYWKLNSTGDDAEEMTQSEKDAVDAARLPALKRTLAAQIDGSASTRIAADDGFEHPSDPTKKFSVSLTAQVKWIGMMVQRGSLTYPIEVPTKDNRVVHSIADATEVASLYAAGVARVKTLLDAATAAKKSVLAATTVADAQAAADAYLNS